MEARNKKIEDWFSMIKQGQIVLPRFQRHEAWRYSQVVGLLENVLREPALPIGALLTLDVGDKELFLSRPISGAPMPNGKPHMHLLDGQQRLTALWKSLNGEYPAFDLFVSISRQPMEDMDDEEMANVDIPQIEVVRRWERKGVLQPVWANSAVETLERGLIPMAVLCPGMKGEESYDNWKAEIRQTGASIPDEVIERVSAYRQRIAKYDIPFLSLKSNTGRETALQVFINMNTSATPLKDFDIVVAQVEEATGESLHNMVADLLEEVPEARAYGKIEDSILSVAALLDGKAPLKKNYLEKSFGESLGRNWPLVKLGFKRGLMFLRSEAIFNEKCLPSDIILYLICALWANIPEHGLDAEGNARSILRKALWRACYTDRYGKTSATRAYADYKTIKLMLERSAEQKPCELFDETAYPLPAQEELIAAGWPGRKDRLPRAMLATALRAGGYDFADGAPAHAENLDHREFHHLYPVAVLEANRKDERVNRALNCALISWTTNRNIAASTPREYIEKRAAAANLGSPEVQQRLASHLIPYDELIEGDYEKFLIARAQMIEERMKLLCQGKIPS